MLCAGEAPDEKIKINELGPNVYGNIFCMDYEVRIFPVSYHWHISTDAFLYYYYPGDTPVNTGGGIIIPISAT